jgi:hypothetical protein
MSTDKQIAANRENGKLSHGATTPEGKSASSMNALKHGLFSAKVLLPTEDLAAYESLVAAIFSQYKPATAIESHLIQSVADTEWKLMRIDRVEAGIYAFGHLKNETSFPEGTDPDHRFIMVEGLIHHEYGKTFHTITSQQAKLQRFMEKRLTQFEKLRAEREIVEVAERDQAMNSMPGDPKDTSPMDPKIGVVFSAEFMLSRLEFHQAAPTADIAVFDRTWRDKRAKVPA